MVSLSSDRRSFVTTGIRFPSDGRDRPTDEHETNMILSDPLETPSLLLRTLHAADASKAYLSWLSDPEVIQFLEVRFSKAQELDDLADYVSRVNASPDNLMLGIFLKSDESHIGNIKLGPIVAEHSRAEIGFLIGDKASWGKGYAPEAIRAVSHYGLDVLGLAKITAGCYETNVGSSKALLKAGFTHEATRPFHSVSGGRRVSSLLYGFAR